MTVFTGKMEKALLIIRTKYLLLLMTIAVNILSGGRMVWAKRLLLRGLLLGSF